MASDRFPTTLLNKLADRMTKPPIHHLYPLHLQMQLTKANGNTHFCKRNGKGQEGSTPPTNAALPYRMHPYSSMIYLFGVCVPLFHGRTMFCLSVCAADVTTLDCLLVGKHGETTLLGASSNAGRLLIEGEKKINFN